MSARVADQVGGSLLIGFDGSFDFGSEAGLAVQSVAPKVKPSCSLGALTECHCQGHTWSVEKQRSSADAEHVPGLIAPLGAFAGAHAGRLGLLALADQGEKAAEALVLQHGRLGDAPQLVEGPVGHAPVLVADLQAP